MLLTPWEPFPSPLFLSPHDIHIWKVSFDSFSSQIAHYQSFLDQEELARANRFHFEVDRHHFTPSRGILRHLLSIYLNCTPQNVTFTYNAHGKPALVENPALFFNVSHSCDLVVYAFAYGRECGIDIEYCRTDRNMHLVAKSFSDSEQAQLNELSDTEYFTGFYRCWTRKEAYIKASGKGFSIPLKSFDVSLEDAHPCLLQIEGDLHIAREWKLINLPLSVEYAGTLAVHDHSWTPHFYHYQETRF